VRSATVALLAVALSTAVRCDAVAADANESPLSLATASQVLSDGLFENRSSEEVYREIARQAHLEVTFESELRHGQVSFLLDGLTVERALALLGGLTQQFVVPLNQRSILVLRDIPSNRTAYTPILLREFAPENADPRDLAAMLRTVLDAQQVDVDTRRRTLTWRDDSPRLALGTRLIAIHDRRPWRVRVEIGRAQLDAPLPRRPSWLPLEVLGRLDREMARATSTVGVFELTGAQPGTWSLPGAMLKDALNDSPAVRAKPVLVEATARLHRTSREVSLDLSLLAPCCGDRTTRYGRAHLRLGDGETVLVRVAPGTFTGSPLSPAAVIALTPHIVDLGERAPGDADVIWCGTERQLLPLVPSPRLAQAQQIVHGLTFESISTADAYRAIAGQAGIRVLLDPHLEHTNRRLRLDGLTVDRALSTVTSGGGCAPHYVAPLTERSVLVVPWKVRHALEPIGLRVFKLESADARDLAAQVRQLSHAAIADPPGLTLTVRAEAPQLEQIERLVEDAESRAALADRPPQLLVATRQPADWFGGLPSIRLPYRETRVADSGPASRRARGLSTDCPPGDGDEAAPAMVHQAARTAARDCRERLLRDARRQSNVRLEVAVTIELISLPQVTVYEVSQWREQALQAAMAKHDLCLVAYVLVAGSWKERSIADRATAAAQAITLATEGDCKAELATALYALATTRSTDRERLAALLERSAALAKVLDYVDLYVSDLTELIRLYREQKDSRAARSGEELVRYLQSHGEEAAWDATWDLGLTWLELGNTEAALPYLRSFIAHQRQVGRDSEKESAFLQAIGDHRVVAGRWYAGAPPGI
jgi:hypothetical protein